jgi:hypothetical protein
MVITSIETKVLSSQKMDAETLIFPNMDNEKLALIKENYDIQAFAQRLQQ